MSELYESSPDALAEAWRAAGRQIAVIAGSAVALLSLFQKTPVWVASFRGAMTWGAVLALTSVGAWFAHRTWRAPDPEPDAANEPDPAGAE